MKRNLIENQDEPRALEHLYGKMQPLAANPGNFDSRLRGGVVRSLVLALVVTLFASVAFPQRIAPRAEPPAKPPLGERSLKPMMPHGPYLGDGSLEPKCFMCSAKPNGRLDDHYGYLYRHPLTDQSNHYGIHIPATNPSSEYGLYKAPATPKYDHGLRWGPPEPSNANPFGSLNMLTDPDPATSPTPPKR